jgi:GT2 family glycosyltransferase
MIDLSIIIVNYNVKEFVKNLLSSIDKATRNLKHEVIIVDNNSTDGSVAELKSDFPQHLIIENKENVGFGKANNQALEIAKGKLLLLINPDTIVREDTFDKLIHFFNSHPEAGMAGCKVLNPDGTLQLACRRSYPTPWVSFCKAAGLSTLFPNSRIFAKYNLTYLPEDEINEVDAISGAFMMFRKEVYEKIGGFDPQFFMYGEDLDLCYRTQQAGFKVYYVPDTEIIHYKGESTRRSNIDETRIFYDAMHLFVKKHFSSSIIVEIILRSAIVLRKFVTFLNVYKLPLIAVIIDYCIFLAALVLAESMYNPGSWQGFPENVKPWVYLIPGIVQAIVSLLGGSYRKDVVSVLRFIISFILGFVVLSSLTFFFKQFGYSRAVFLICFSMAGTLSILWRTFIKIKYRIGSKDFDRKHRTLLVGDEDSIKILLSRLKSNITEIYNIQGLIGIDRMLFDKRVENHQFLGSLENIKKVVINNKINTVVFSSDKISYEKIFNAVAECQGLNVQFLMTGVNQNYLVGKAEITSLEEIPFTRLYYNISATGHQIIKVLFDIVISFIVLIAVYPFVILKAKVFGKKSKFTEFISQVPSIFLLKKSFVGPQFNSYDDGLYLGRIGLTGLWQFENFDENDLDNRKKINLYYAKNQNIWLDLDILGRTLSNHLFKKEK